MYAQLWRPTVSFICLTQGTIMPTLNTIFPKNYPTIKSLRLNMRSLSLFKARGNEHRPLEKKRTKKKLMKIVASAQTLNTGRCMLVPKIPRKTEPKEN